MKPVLIICAAAFCAFAQDTTIRVDVQQVVVPVIVADKAGRHVSGLKESDFRVLEDGVPQKITSFSGGPSASGTYIICVDTLHTSPASAARIRDILEKLFDGIKPGDAQYALIGIGRQLQVLQTATNNPLALLVKLRGTGFQQNFGGYDRSVFDTQIAALRRRTEDFCHHCACSARQAPPGCAGEIEALKQDVDSEAAQWNVLNRGLLEQFRSVVDELGKIGTSRTLILVSDGFEYDARRDFYRVVAGYLPGRPQFQVEDSTDAALNAALRVAADKNIRIDTIDSRTGTAVASTAAVDPMDAGLSTGINAQSTLGTNRSNVSTPVRQTTLGSPSIQPVRSEVETSRSMDEMAKLTGGAYAHTPDLLKEFRTAMGDGREYYVLTYVPTNNAQDGAFRHISVETMDRKLTIRAKSGYWAPTGAQ